MNRDTDLALLLRREARSITAYRPLSGTEMRQASLLLKAAREIETLRERLFAKEPA